MKKKNGFTLIELLAIIVILAIIAVITVPIILNVIENSKKSAAIDSSYGYKDSIYKGFVGDLALNPDAVLPNGVFVIDNTGKLVDQNGVVLNTNISGTEPEENGWVELERGQVVAYSLKFDDYTVTKYKDTEAEAVKNGEIAENSVAREARLELERQTQAKSDAKTLATSQTGTTGIVEITDGWVAFINGEVVAYSVKVTEGDYTYVVTDLDVDSNNTNAIANRNTTEFASTLATEERIISYKVDSYVKAALTANSSLTADTVKTVSEMSGVTTNAADSGWIQFEYKNSTLSVKDYSLQYGSLNANYSSLTSGNYVSTISISGSIRNKPILIAGVIIDGVKYYDTSWINEKDGSGNAVNAIYYNPGHVSNNPSEVVEAGPCTAGETGCLKWYAFSEFSEVVNEATGETRTYVNLLLDHNTTAEVQWASEADYMGIGDNPVSPAQNSRENSVGITYHESKTTFVQYSQMSGSCNNSKGPLTVLNRLHADTDSWNLETRSDIYIPPTGSYTINYSGYKARLISAEEIAIIIQKNTIENPNTWSLGGSTIYFGSLNATSGYSSQSDSQMERQRSYSWLFDNTDNCISAGCSLEDSSTKGYWTSTLYPNLTNNTCNRAWLVGFVGAVYNTPVDSSLFGVRPVITVLASEVM